MVVTNEPGPRPAPSVMPHHHTAMGVSIAIICLQIDLRNLAGDPVGILGRNGTASESPCMHDHAGRDAKLRHAPARGHCFSSPGFAMPRVSLRTLAMLVSSGLGQGAVRAYCSAEAVSPGRRPQTLVVPPGDFALPKPTCRI